MEVSILEAAQRLSVSPDTVRRRVRSGSLPAHQETRGKAYRWLVDLPDNARPAPGYGAADGLQVGAPGADQVHHLEQMVEELRSALAIARGELEARRREVSQLLGLLRARDQH